jgi:hypothetical protein
MLTASLPEMLLNRAFELPAEGERVSAVADAGGDEPSGGTRFVFGDRRWRVERPPT